MRIVAMLAWWDEPADDLYDCVKSMRTLCDAVVAVDGAYEMTPGATRLSPPEQMAAIKQAAHDYGMDCAIYLPEKIWTGQVEKRAAMLEEACRDADWVIAVDSDHRLVGDREKIRKELARIGHGADSILHSFHTPMPENPAELLRLSPHPWHTELAGKTIDHSLLFRVLDDMRIDRDHWGYSGVRPDGLRIAVGNWHGSQHPHGMYHRLAAPFRVDHMCFDRDLMRLDRNRAYCKTRDAFKLDNGYEP